MSEKRTLDWKAAGLFRLGEEAQAEERYADASRYYQEVLRLAEDHEPACFNRGVTVLRRGQARAAAGIFSSLLGKELPERPVTRQLPIVFNLALAQACAGELEPAFEAARLVLRGALDPDQPTDDGSLLRRRIAGPALALFALVSARHTGLRPAGLPPELAPLTRDELVTRVRDNRPAEPLMALHAAELARETTEEPRTQYLLACYDCLGESIETAFDELEDALTHDRGSIEWARRDPLLEPLRAADPREFRTLIRWARLGRAAVLERFTDS